MNEDFLAKMKLELEEELQRLTMELARFTHKDDAPRPRVGAHQLPICSVVIHVDSHCEAPCLPRVVASRANAAASKIAIR